MFTQTDVFLSDSRMSVILSGNSHCGSSSRTSGLRSVDAKIKIYILSIFLKVQNFLITVSNIGAQRFVNMEKFTFEVDNLRK